MSMGREVGRIWEKLGEEKEYDENIVHKNNK